MNVDFEPNPFNANCKLQIVAQLLDIAERAFVHKLLKRHPDMIEADVKSAIRNWYATRPGAEHGDGVGVPGDPKRFDQ